MSHIYTWDIIYSTKKRLSQLISIWCVEKPNCSLYETSDMCSPLNYVVGCIASKEYNRIIQMTGQCAKCYFNTHSTSNWGKRTYPKSNTCNFSLNCYKSKLAKLIFFPLWLLLKSSFLSRLHLLLCSPEEILQPS